MTALLSTFQVRLYAGEADLPAIAQLINFCKTADNLDDLVTVDELRHDYDDPEFNPDRDLRLWTTSTGELCAVAACWLPAATDVQRGYLGFSIHPQVREMGIEAEVFTWAETLLAEVARPHHVPAKLHSGTRNDQQARLTLLTQHEFIPDRTFYRMARSLADPIPAPQLPEGFSIRPLQGKTEAAAWAELFNQSFIDHWNFHAMSVEDRTHWFEEPNYLPDLDLIAVAPDGTLVTFCYAMIHAQENELTGRLEGWIADLGTRRGFRRMGLGRAMLLTGLHVLQAKGMDTAMLGVDSENPSGALALYQSVGFQQRYSFISHVKDIAQVSE